MKTSTSFAAALSRSSRMVDAGRGATISAIGNLYKPHPEERPLGRVSKDGDNLALMVRDGAARLLTMRTTISLPRLIAAAGWRGGRRAPPATAGNRLRPWPWR